jgi:hypothetical protein
MADIANLFFMSAPEDAGGESCRQWESSSQAKVD